jgi:dTDP-4-amino-4,6-dideoxygalactose transaminase
MFKVNMSPGAKDLVSEVLDSGMIGEGPKVLEFRDKLAGLFGVQEGQTICTNSCTSALTLALRLCDIGPGDSVVSSPFTMVATNCAIKAAGADIIWGKTDPRTACLDLEDICEEVRARGGVRAVVVTLVGGLVPFYLEEFLECMARHSVRVIFDAAHALTTTYKGRHIAQFPDCCAFSFQAIKHLTTGNGGALVCRDEWQARRAEKLKWFGMSREVPEGKTRLQHQMEYSIPEWGYKFEMNDIQAAIGLANFDLALAAAAASAQNAQEYNRAFEDLGARDIYILEQPEEANPSWWVYGLRPGQWYSRQVDNAARVLREDYDVQATTMWKLNSWHQCFFNSGNGINPPRSMPLFLPNGFWIGKAERDHIIGAVQEVLQGSQ